MKTFLAVFSALILLLAGSLIYAQQYEDVVYLKNGSIIHGTIIEQVPNVSIKIKTNDGNVFVYTTEEIQKMTKEEIKSNDEESSVSTSKTKKNINRFNICAYGGLNFANVSVNPASTLSESTLTLWHIGVMGDFNWGDYFRNSTYFEFCRRGADDAFDTKGAWVIVDYLNIENAFKAGSFLTPVKPYALISVLIGFKLGASVYAPGGAATDYSSNVSGFDAGLSFGGGVELPVSKSISIVPELKYYLGLTDANSASFTTSTIKHNGFETNVGVKFYF